jgi:hypothetical protein
MNIRIHHLTIWQKWLSVWLLGYSVNEYREYKRGTLDNIKLQTMQEWFREIKLKNIKNISK